MRGTDDQRVVDVQKSMGHPVETDTSVGTSVLIPVHRSIFLDDKYTSKAPLDISTEKPLEPGSSMSVSLQSLCRGMVVG